MVSLPIKPFTENDMKILRTKFDCVSLDSQIIIWMADTELPVPSRSSPSSKDPILVSDSLDLHDREDSAQFLLH